MLTDTKKYVFTPQLKMIAYVLIALGVVGLGYGIFAYHGEHPHRLWANLLLNGVFFLGISMAAAFFISAHYLAWGGWFVVVKRIPEAIMGYLPIGAAILFAVLIFGQHDLYHWAHHGVVEEGAADYDPILAGKHGYLNNIFYYSRFILFVGALVFLAYLIRRNSIDSDNGNIADSVKFHKKNLVLVSIFIPIFAVYISVSAWDWLMSIDPHWYSTMYGWYVFASFWVTGIAVITLTTLHVKSKGYLKEVNVNHLHDLGKYMFAFSIFWTYVTYCQFMLIWYANIPEETIYFKHRFEHYKTLFFLVFILNFVFPFLILMSRDAKRNVVSLTAAACIIILGHFLDFYLMIMPGVLGDHAGFGILEICLPCLFIGILILVTHTRLGNAELINHNHPHLEESLHHEI